MKKTNLLLASLFLLLFAFQAKVKAQTGTKITQTTLVETKLNYVVHNVCNGDKKGAINVMVSGGIPPYKYKWSNGATSQDLTGLPAGIYTLFVKDAYGCPDTLIVEVKEPPKLKVTVDSINDILCYGFDNGFIEVSVTGGLPPYIYSWSNGSAAQDLKNAEAGEYALLVTDANHCQEIASGIIKQNPLIVRSDEKVQNVKCSGDSVGIIDISVKGGVAPYSYRWTSGQRTEDLSHLVAGTYTVMVTDSKGCAESYSTAVTEPNPIELTVENVRHINCADDKSGAININVKGGVPPYTYSWNDGVSTAQDIAGIGAGKYHLLIKDSKECKKVFDQEIKEPGKLTVNIKSVKHVLNYGGSDGAVYINVNGGVEPYKYEWSNGAKSQDVANIPANNYTCRITDANNCVNMLSVNIEQPALLEANIEHIENNKCFGEKNGYINVVVKGGVQPYKYAWSNGETTEDIKNLGAGTYTLIVTDGNSVTRTVKADITQPEKLASNVQTITNIPCFGNNDGLVDVNVKGGTPPYTYNWSNGSKTQDLTKVPAGNYSLQIIDKNQCVDSLKASVSQSPELIVKPLEVVDIKCYGRAEGAINIDISGGVQPYVFNWSNGIKTRNLSKLAAGGYNLRVSDVKGCEKSLDVTIKEPPLLVTTLGQITDVKCKGDSTGAINLNANGGTPPYTYAWSNGKNLKDNTRIKAGSYSVKITDAMGCSNTLSATIKEPTKLQSALGKVENIDCYNDKTGVISVSVGGGVPPYIYKWSNNATTQNLLGVGAGDYVLTVRDQNNCISEVKATVAQNRELKSSIQGITHVSCYGSKTGAVQVNVAGGIEPYTYKWSNGLATKDLANVEAGAYRLNIADARGCAQVINVMIDEPPLFEGEIANVKQISCYNDSNGMITTAFRGGKEPYSFEWSNKRTTKDIKNLKAGTYTLMAKDNNGCTNKLSVDLVQPPKLELKLVALRNNLCNGEHNGSIDISVEGGIKPYVYKWSNGDSTQDLVNLMAGKYSVQVTGATGCQVGFDATITEPSPLELKVVSSTDVNCNGGNNGAIDLSVKGGKEPYTYSWSNGAITQDIKDLVAGSYTANITDANGCFNSISAIIKQPDPLVAKIADVKNINCYGDSTGAISIDVTGGTQPYAYKWSSGATTEDIQGLKMGKYSIDIKDAKGCAQSLTTTITQPDMLISKVISTHDVDCNGTKEGSIDISVSGGVTPYAYTWSNGSKEQDIANIAAGKYDVVIQDAKGCNRKLSAEIKEPSAMVVSVAEVKNMKEYGSKSGSIKIAVSGGKSPYTFSWSNGATTQDISNLEAGNYSVIIKDAAACRKDLSATIIQPEGIEIVIDTINHIRCYGEKMGYVKISATGGVPPYKFSWDNGLTGNVLKNVPSGKYIITVTDANEVSKQKQIAIDQPGIFKLKIDSVKNPTCYELNNGMIKTDIQGGTTPYGFKWSNGAISQDLKGITSGKYVIRATDAKGCTLSDSAELTKPSPLEVKLASTEHIKCNGEPNGKVSISVTGGVPPYQFSWDHGAIEQNLINVMAGNYNIKVLDANNCLKSVSTTINEPPVLVAKIETVKNVPCKGEKRGSVTTSVTGGTPPYMYKWNNGDSSAVAANLIAGNYNVSITDANGCKSSLAAIITEPEILTGQVSNVSDIKCNGDKEGSISIDVRGGTAPYIYDWSNGSKDKNQVSVIAGKYSVKVSDKQGCEIVLDAEIKEPSKLIAELTEVQNVKCFGDNAGSINVTVKGGVEPYSYAWSNGATTQDLLKIPANNYSLMVKDAKGCFTILNAKVEEPQKLMVDNTAINNIKCNGEKAGEVTISVKGGKEPYKYQWSNGNTTRDIQNVVAGSYKLTVTDANECATVYTANVVEPPVLAKSIDAVKHISCNGESNGSINISVSGGMAPYAYQWSNGVTTQDLLDVPAGKYSVLIKEANGCETSLEVTITEPAPFKSELLSVDHNVCYGDYKGSIKIKVEGGTLPYSFKWNNGATTQNLEEIVSGDYAVLIADANGCNNTIKATVEEPPKLVLTIDSARNVKCCGDTSGAIFISIKGGVAPYNYHWSHGKTTQDVTGLKEGQYTVTVTDTKLCVVSTPEEGTTIYEKIIAQGKFVTRDILFDIDKATIKEASFIEISRIASFMKEHPDIKFSIEGHTDNQGGDEYNMKLSLLRSKAIKEALIKFGISERRLDTRGYGLRKPISTNATPEGRALNRRVEFIPL